MNRNYAYSKSSITRLKSCSPDIERIAMAAISIASNRKMHCPDFGISAGLRTVAEQQALYAKGRTSKGSIVTNCDGVNTKSVHQSGDAIDFYAYVDGKANYEPGNIALIATCFFEAASNLGIDVDWGGSFRSISDGAHFEISR